MVELTRSANVSRLVGRAREGDREAFGELYRLHQPAVYRLVRFHLPPAEAEDAVAETFLRAWRALPRYRDRGVPFAAWLYGIARHVVADERRRARRTAPVAEVPDRAVAVDGDEDRLDLAAAVARLPEDQRTVVELKFLVGLRNEEVGRVLRRSAGAVNALQWRALVALRRLLAGGERS